MTRLIFVRHGQSTSNLEKRFSGQHNPDLTELGHRQAEATAHHLARAGIQAIYSSDLARAYQTAEHTARLLDLEIIPTKGLREINAGDWEGKLYADLMVEFPASYHRWLTDLGHAHPENGESVLALNDRVCATVRQILDENRGKCVAVFTHATPVRMLACGWFGIPVENAIKVPFCTNASISTVEYEDDGSFRLIEYGYDAHQGDLITQFPKGLV